MGFHLLYVDDEDDGDDDDGGCGEERDRTS
jgi:hypothetical protein